MTLSSQQAETDGEEILFSVFCGGTHLYWATHYGRAQAYTPELFWRTPLLTTTEVKGRSAADLLPVLSRSLPEEPHDYGACSPLVCWAFLPRPSAIDGAV